jgi:hypothetical protein
MTNWGSNMTSLSKIATTGVLTLALAATSLTAATPASAGDNRAGTAIAIGAGLIIGGILLNEHRNHQPHRNRGRGPQVYFNGGYDGYNNAGYQPACFLGPVKYRWVEECREGRHGDLFCHKTQQAFRERICR